MKSHYKHFSSRTFFLLPPRLHPSSPIPHLTNPLSQTCHSLLCKPPIPAVLHFTHSHRHMHAGPPLLCVTLTRQHSRACSLPLLSFYLTCSLDLFQLASTLLSASPASASYHSSPGWPALTAAALFLLLPETQRRKGQKTAEEGEMKDLPLLCNIVS